MALYNVRNYGAFRTVISRIFENVEPLGEINGKPIGFGVRDDSLADGMDGTMYWFQARSGEAFVKEDFDAQYGELLSPAPQRR